MLVISRAKPNPAGRDKSGNRPIARQLLGEWVDLVNNGSTTIHLGGTHLANETYDDRCKRTGARAYWSGSSSQLLAAGAVARIHTGRLADAHLMDVHDQLGAQVHLFAESDQFVLNNRCGDKLTLWARDAAGNWRQPPLDSCSYDPNPPEGVVLVRSGDRLVASAPAWSR